MNPNITGQIDLKTIEAGLNNGEFFLEYLPTISLEDMRCIGAEALIRWRHSSRVIPPLEFIPIIENTTLSGIVTYWVIETVAQELGNWLRNNKNVHLSFNVPPEILGRGGLRYAAEKSGLIDMRDKIILEITERGIPDKLGIDELNEAHSLGTRIAFDDIWVSHINLAILCRTTADILKIDKAFMDEMLLDNWSSEKLIMLSNLVHNTDIEVVAEGVESMVQVEILKEVGIQMAQGWYFSRPLSAQSFQEFFYANQ